jgi:hypothetical protein
MEICSMRILTLLSLCILPLPASAELMFQTNIGHWIIYSTPDGCIAQNRPSLEMGIGPINMLWLDAKPDGRVSLSIAFWPGALQDSDTEIRLKLASLEVTLPAIARLDPFVVLQPTAPLAPDLLDTFAGRGDIDPYALQISTNVSDTSTTLDVQDLPRVMGELSRCVYLYGEAK